MSRKGFTMIELLAAMVLLSLLTMISVPTVLSVMNNNRKNTLVSDAEKFISNVSYLINSNNNNIKRPREKNSCIVITLDYLDIPDELKKGPHNKLYARDKSYVVVKRVEESDDGKINLAKRYDYYVTLVEEQSSGNYFGILNAYQKDLNKKSFKKTVAYVDSGNIYEKGNNTSKIKNNAGNSICSSVVYYGKDEREALNN